MTGDSAWQEFAAEANHQRELMGSDLSVFPPSPV